LERFQHTQNPTSVLSALLSNANSLKILVPQLISHGLHRQPESADFFFFFKFNLSHKLVIKCTT